MRDRLEIVSSIKKEVESFIEDSIEEASSEEIDDELESPIGKIAFEVDKYGLKQSIIYFRIKLSTSNADGSGKSELKIDVVLGKRNISISVRNLSIYVNSFAWQYRQIAFPHMKGGGDATFVIRVRGERLLNL